ncbi:glucose/arabinose dehydrogenase [Peteryoungia aggregata LMG 23059]|uniref:Glucose/arabinose dehydrogenase n=2 Tax=Peteryoungia aggregata TaxID=34013 RepID=A0ABU0GFQ3_9HYPH|nr:PQQ-dependent sugar dehydrogenase [Peteryoungia aggregata]MDQ0423460.1 glucose/arabinose dehydrogenase [Peteryoungia aggregata LMG 23059]
MPTLLGRYATLAAPLLALALPASAEEPREHRAGNLTLKVTSIAGGLEHPWSVEVLPDGAYIVTERPGRMRIIRDGEVGRPLGGLPRIAAVGQGGLLDIAIAPDFAETRRLFFTAAVPGPGGQGTGVFSARLSENERRLEDVRRIFLMNKLTGAGQHFGSRIAIAADGSLFFGIGDRGDEDRAQDPADHAGKIMRINADGMPSSANPKGQPLPEVWSSGHRNPQGITIDPKDDRLFTVEHGARGGDEINAPEAGNNYGWPVISYGKHYSGAEIGIGQRAEGYEQPLHYWDPSIAPGALAVYRGAMFPEWDGDFLVAALKYQLITRIERGEDGSIGSEERMIEGEYGRIRDVKVAPDGSLLLVTDEEEGQLLRITRGGES